MIRRDAGIPLPELAAKVGEIVEILGASSP
jgi:hypothetical protein